MCSHALNEEFLAPMFTIQICSVFAAKRPVSLLSGTNPKYFFSRKIRKQIFGHNLGTEKDISKILKDSDSAEQQLKDSKKYNNSLINKKAAYILPKL